MAGVKMMRLKQAVAALASKTLHLVNGIALRVWMLGMIQVPWDRWGAWLQGTAFVCTIALLIENPFPPGVAVVLVGVVAVLMTFREKYAKGIEHICWIAILSALSFVEIRTILNDRADSERRQSELTSFAHLQQQATFRQMQRLNTQSEKIADKQTQLVNKQSKQLDVMTGGSSYPVVDVGPDITEKSKLALYMTVHGKNDLVNVSVSIMLHKQRMNESNALQMFASRWKHDYPLIESGIASLLGFTFDPQDDPEIIQIDIGARNGRYTELLTITKDAKSAIGWAQKIKVIGSKGVLAEY